MFELPVASVPWESPLFWALLIGWIFTVALHEFAHGLVAHFGGDYTVRERGGLTLNPFQYIDPLMSIGLPLLFLIMGGVPLPGGVTYIRTDLLRSKAWESTVALAGPAMNLLLLCLLTLCMHPAFGYFDYSVPVESWTNLQIFVGALATLQAISVVLNLLPVPGLDGFNAISPYLNQDFVMKVRTPPLNFIILAVLFLMVMRLPIVWQLTGKLLFGVPRLLGMGDSTAIRMFESFGIALGR